MLSLKCKLCEYYEKKFYFFASINSTIKKNGGRKKRMKFEIIKKIATCWKHPREPLRILASNFMSLYH